MRRTMIRLALAYACAAQALAFAPPGGTLVREISIRGNHALSDREILSRLVTRPSRPYSPPQLRADLSTLVESYRAEGYYFADAAVESLEFSPDSAWVGVMLGVREGERYLLGAVTLGPAGEVPQEELLAAMETRPGSVLDPKLLEEDIARILSRLERQGYPFASVRIAAVEARPDAALLDLRLSVDPGGLVRVRDVRVEGNSSTSANVILRETRMRLPELYDAAKVARIADRLRRLNLFAGVAEPQLLMTDSGGVLLLRVEEGKSSSFDGVVGYAPAPSADGEGVLAGSVNLDLRNMFGTARMLGVRWQRDGRSSQDIRLQYVEPWAFGLPVNLGGLFQQRQQDSIYVRRAVGARSDVLLTESFTLGASVSHEVTIPSAGAGANPVASSRTLTAGIEVLYDSRNDHASPTGGILYRSEYRIGEKKTFGGSAAALEGPSSLQQASLDLEWYVQLLSQTVVMAGVHGRQVTNRRLEVSDLYRFGGARTLRGYRELQFLGSRVVWTNLEYRLLLSRRSFGYGFFDTGYYALPADDALGTASAQGVKYGYGVGIRLETGLGDVGVSFALGEGDALSQGKIHVSLINEF